MNENNGELCFPLINYKLKNKIISIKIDDGYVNASALCAAADKKMSNYKKSEKTKQFLKFLSENKGIPITALEYTVTGGLPELQGTWIHPDLAMNLGYWLSKSTRSPKFTIRVTDWVLNWMVYKEDLKTAMYLTGLLQFEKILIDRETQSSVTFN